MGKPISNNNKRICIWLQHWECMGRSEHLPSMDQVLASIFSALESNRNCVAHIYQMIASLWMMTVLTYFTYGVGTRKRTYVKYTKGTWVLEGMMREWHEEIVFCHSQVTKVSGVPKVLLTFLFPSIRYLTQFYAHNGKWNCNSLAQPKALILDFMFLNQISSYDDEQFQPFLFQQRIVILVNKMKKKKSKITSSSDIEAVKCPCFQ